MTLFEVAKEITNRLNQHVHGATRTVRRPVYGGNEVFPSATSTGATLNSCSTSTFTATTGPGLGASAPDRMDRRGRADDPAVSDLSTPRTLLREGSRPLAAPYRAEPPIAPARKKAAGGPQVMTWPAKPRGP